MASKTFGVNDALSNKLWSAKLAKEVEKKTYFGKFMGEGEDNIVQVKTETGKSAGDKVTCGLVMSLTGDGVTEGGTLEGNEESLATYDDSIFINELRHAVRVKNSGTIDAQRVPYNLRSVSRNRLAQWYATRMDTTMFLHLCGYTGAAFSRDNQTVDPSKSVYNGNNTVLAPSSNRIIRADGNANDQSITSATDDKFVLELLDEALLQIDTSSPLIQPIMVGGEPKYVGFLHPAQVKDLRTDVSDSRITWFDLHRASLEGGENRSANPIYSGAVGEYNGIILHKAFRIPNGVHSSTSATVANTKRAVICGAQSAAVAYGRKFSGATKYKWQEELFDYEHELGTGAEVVWGLKKTVFNSEDYGTMVITTYGAD